MFSLDRTKNDTSVLLDLLRAVAAQMVCVGHATIFFRYDWAPVRLPLPQNFGVLLFFIISGFLITYTLVERSEKPDYGFGQFFIERFARIYSGLLPALALVIVVDQVVFALTGPNPEIGRYSNLPTLFANLAMLEGYRGINGDVMMWAPFGSASPLWTLAIEWHIYLFAASVFFMGARPRWIPLLIPVALFFGQVPMHYLLGALQEDGVGRGLFTLWLGGALAWFAARAIGGGVKPAIAGWAAGLSAVAYLAFTHARAEYNFRTYLLLWLSFLCAVVATQATHAITSKRIIRAIRFAADYSFSLYLVHYTVLYSLKMLWPEAGLAGFAIGILLSNLAAIALAEIGEKHHRALARWLKRSLARRSAPESSESIVN